MMGEATIAAVFGPLPIAIWIVTASCAVYWLRRIGSWRPGRLWFGIGHLATACAMAEGFWRLFG